jgi:hypothetical protein
MPSSAVVKTLVTEPISKIVSGGHGIAGVVARAEVEVENCQAAIPSAREAASNRDRGGQAEGSLDPSNSASASPRCRAASATPHAP